MSKLRALLLRFLHVGVEDGEGDTGGAPADAAGAEGGEGGEDDDGTGDETLDELIDAVAPGAGVQADAGEVSAAALRESRRRAQETQTELENERRLRLEAESRNRGTQRPDPQWQAEEDEIARARTAGATAEQLSWVQWKVDSSRAMRQGAQTSNQALMEARDIADRTEFNRLELTKPGIFKRYAKRVEEAVDKMRQQGGNAPRLGVLKLLIGDDLIAGNVRPAKKKAAAGGEPGTVARGRSPDMRSDAAGKGGTSEREKRRARLENVRI